MPTNTEKIKVVIEAQNKTDKAFRGANTGVNKLKDSITTMAAVAVPAMVLALGVKAVRAAADFEKGMSNVATLVDTGVEDMKAMSNAVLDISRRVPVTAEELTSALYNIRSAGISAADAMMILEKSAKLGVAGLGSTEEAVDLATSAINSFNLEGRQVAEVFDIIQLTVKSGKTTIAELAQSFGMVAGTAKTAGVELTELMAATAALTTTGLKASVAQTQLRAAILAIQAPTADMARLLSDAGFESGSAAIEADGLVSVMNDLKVAADGDVSVLKKAFGSVEALGAVLSLTGEQLEIFNSIMAESEEATGTLDEAFVKATDNYRDQVALLKGELNVTLIKLGNVIIPILLKIFKALNGYLQNALFPTLGILKEWFTNVGNGIKWVVETISELIANVIIAISKLRELISLGGGVGFGGILGKAFKVGLPGFADGGIVNAPLGMPIPAIVHGGERVIPAGGGSGAGGLTINFYNNQFTDEDSSEMHGNNIVDILKRNIRL